MGEGVEEYTFPSSTLYMLPSRYPTLLTYTKCTRFCSQPIPHLRSGHIATESVDLPSVSPYPFASKYATGPEIKTEPTNRAHKPSDTPYDSPKLRYPA